MEFIKMRNQNGKNVINPRLFYTISSVSIVVVSVIIVILIFSASVAIIVAVVSSSEKMYISNHKKSFTNSVSPVISWISVIWLIIPTVTTRVLVTIVRIFTSITTSIRSSSCSCCYWISISIIVIVIITTVISFFQRFNIRRGKKPQTSE